MENKLWYTMPPTEWMEGLPIGNGRLAAMIWGDENTDRISLNHEWLWRGVHRERDNRQEASHLQEIRECLRQGDYLRATELANAYLGGSGGVSGKARRVDPYQPAGDLIFTLEDCTAFCRRDLDIQNAVASAERLTAGNTVTSTFIAHPVYNLVICRWSASSGSFSGSLRYYRIPDAEATESCDYSQQGIIYSCAFHGGIQFKTAITVQSDGTVTDNAGGLYIHNASDIVVYVNITTTVKGIENELSAYPIPCVGWSELLLSHVRVFDELLGRMSLEVSQPESSLPTNERIALVRSGAEDATLPLLYFNYGRYLLAASSICGELPANLQGKWNDRIDPPWGCDYHFDINIQMNYWMAEAANMPECAESLVQYIKRFIPHAKKAAADLYGCRGIWVPLASDAWGRATPEACGWAVWIGAAPWIAQHIWRHFEYSGDLNFLRDMAYPFFKEVAQFYEDYLTEDVDGVLQIMPSQSPENRFKGTGTWPVSIGVSSAMDVQLAHDALGYAIKAATILGMDDESRGKWEAMRSHLPVFKIGSDGRLLEWDDEREEAEPGHRHLSHLYGMYPSDIFNPIDRPRQYKAAIKSLQYRMAQGGGHTGWSRAWVACLYARIGNGAELWKHLNALIMDFATVSLLDLHPPRIFQIDGNLGAVEAILQSLVQHWGGKVHLLRALPPAWRNGSLKGVKVPGGHTLELAWSDGKLDTVDIVMGYSGEIVLSGLSDTFALPVGAAICGGDIHITGRCAERYKLMRY